MDITINMEPLTIVYIIAAFMVIYIIRHYMNRMAQKVTTTRTVKPLESTTNKQKSETKTKIRNTKNEIPSD